MFDQPNKPEQAPRQNESRERIQQALKKADGFVEERRMDPYRQQFVRKLIADSLKRPST
ncbi:hypothetical protein HZA44_04845 [Candidatus Peregrinibacteria bacterium]|nr:hypothetical protein [Candidatus Peregrinibacteria bacterium]